MYENLELFRLPPTPEGNMTLAAKFSTIFTMLSAEQVVCRVFFVAENSCLLWLEAGIIKGVRLNHNSQSAGPKTMSVKMLKCSAEPQCHLIHC